MAVVLLLVFVTISFLVVRIGAVALELTGLDRQRATFQALSAFSGTGFTTKEAELVVTHPQRRKIVSILMVLGNAGVVSIIVTFVSSVVDKKPFRLSLNFFIIAVGLYILYRIASSSGLMRRLSEKIRKVLIKRMSLETLTLEEILLQAEGYGITRLTVKEGSRLDSVSLEQSGLSSQGIIVLSIERDGGVIPTPKPGEIINTGDSLICYGKLEAMGAFI